MSDRESGVFVRLPLPDEQVFRYQAADDVLELLYRNPHREFTITELRETTGHGGKSVDTAVQILGALDLVEKRSEGRRSLLNINQKWIQKPDDPVLEIPQEQFRKPVKTLLERIEKEYDGTLVGIVLFGSVARGNADRTSDIDVQVILDDDLPKARRALHSIRQEIENERFDGNRYEIQLLVESVESASNYGEKLREIFSEGITLYSTDDLDDVREVVFGGE